VKGSLEKGAEGLEAYAAKKKKKEAAQSNHGTLKKKSGWMGFG